MDYAVVAGSDDGEKLEHAPELLLVHGDERAAAAPRPSPALGPADALAA
jgi:hypothetical protein